MIHAALLVAGFVLVYALIAWATQSLLNRWFPL